mmetsp:Transcript_10932/g.12860  ORF Transcript_10932/g.12860 Transcript_10932/m.12860 type:complete len:895 (-) Transcript_10932:5695-8379(-)
MHLSHVCHQALLRLVIARHLKVTDELARHAHQRIARPRQEPIDGTTVDQTRELARALRELVTHGGEAQAHVEVVPHTTHEERVQVIPGVDDSRRLTLHHWTHVIHDHVNLILGEETRDLSRHQDLIDVLQETLLLHLRICKDETHLLSLETRHLVQSLDVLKQVRLVVRLRDRNLERESSRDERCKASQALLTRTTHTDQKSRSTVHTHQARNSHHVTEGVFEQHQLKLQRLAPLIEQPLPVVTNILQHRQALNALVEARVTVNHLTRVVIQHRLAQKVHKVERCLHLLQNITTEVLLDQGENQINGPLLVLRSGQLIAEHTLALMPPQREEITLRALHLRTIVRVGTLLVETLPHSQHHALEHLRQLTHVEQVVELRWSRKHLNLNLVPQCNGQRHELRRGLHHRVVKISCIKATFHQCSEDVINSSNRRQRDIEQAELTLETIWNIVLASPGSIHSSNVKTICNKLHVSNGLLKRVHSALLQQLTHNLIGHLVTPVVVERHTDIIHKHNHPLTTGRTESPTLTLLNRAFHRELENIRGGETRKRDSLRHHFIRAEPTDEPTDSRGLRSTGASNEDGAALDRRAQPEELLITHRVQCWDNKLCVLGLFLVLGVLPSGNPDLPVFPLGGLLVHKELEDRILSFVECRHVVRELHHLLVELGSVLENQQTSEGPSAAVDEHALVVPLRKELVRVHARQQAPGQQRTQRRHAAEVTRDVIPGRTLSHRLAVHAHHKQQRFDVLLEQRLKNCSLLWTPSCQPRLGQRLPPKLSLGHVNNTGARHRGGGGIVQVLRLEHRLHQWAHGDTVTIGKGQDLVVIEHSVQVLNPDSVHGAVQHDPCVLVLVLRSAAPQHRKHTIGPVTSRSVHTPEHLRRGNRLRVHLPDLVLLAQCRQSST